MKHLMAAGIVWWAVMVVAACAQDATTQPSPPTAVESDDAPSTSKEGDARPKAKGIEHFRMESKLLTNYWGRPIFLEAGVVLPPDYERGAEDTPFCYSIHGFGGSHRSAWLVGPRLREKMRHDEYPRFIYVFLNANCPLGHHEFADSANNGPWGQALTEELIPALESHYGGSGLAGGRFLTGHSSGGWSSLWLQITYPDFFAGTWSTAPDSVDFRDFTGVNVYSFDNAYFDPAGEEIPLVRKRGSEEWVATIKTFAQREVARKPYGGQMASFDAVFSPRGEDGRPMQLYDRKTGKIDPIVARAWEKYDIRLILKRRWHELEPKLRGKIHVYIGDVDTFRLEGAVELLKTELEDLGSDAEIVIVEGRDHGSIKRPYAKLWPDGDGLMHYIHHEMWKRWVAEPRTVPLVESK